MLPVGMCAFSFFPPFSFRHLSCSCLVHSFLKMLLFVRSVFPPLRFLLSSLSRFPSVVIFVFRQVFA